MDINPQIFKSYDIRGIYPTDLNEETVKDITKAIYTFFRKEKPEGELSVVLGHDMRLSSPQLFEVAKNTLREMGAKVIDIGLVSTPTFYFAVYHYKYDCGFQITASHNPKEWNGMKIVKYSPKGLVKIGKTTGMEEVKEIALNKVFVESKQGGLVEEKTEILEDEIKEALRITNEPNIKKYKIAADPANAMGAQYIDAIFKHIPGELIKMNFDLDGSFPAHQPDPLQAENLADLQKKVLAEKADIGLAPDGDGDRLFFIDEKGQIVPPTIITSIIAKEFLKLNKNDLILFDIRYILTPQKIVEEQGGKSKITKVGHAFITESLNETGGVFAGESSAHYYYKSNGNTESQILTILFTLKVMSETGKSMGELIEMYRRSYESGEINFETDKSKEIIEQLAKKYQDGEVSSMDGIAINYPDWRFSVRTSNTEPLLRLNVEALQKETMEKNRDDLVQLIKDNS